MSHRHKQQYHKLPGYGLSQHAPYLPGEDASDRHRRRYANAVFNRSKVREWCRHRGVIFNCKQFKGTYGERWEFRAPGKFANWTPHLGRLFAKPELHSSRVMLQKVYDWEQLLNALEQWLEGSMS